MKQKTNNSQPSNNKTLWITIVVLSIMAVTIWSLDIVIYINKNNNNAGGGGNNTSDITVGNTEDKPSSSSLKIPLEELTKEQAINAYLAMHEVGYKPKGFVDKLIIPTDNEWGVVLVDSYETIDRIPELELEPSSDYNVLASENDYYAVITAKISEETKTSRRVSFNKKFLDYDSRTLTFNDTSAEFAKVALPIIVLTTGSGTYFPLSSIYDYSFEETANSISLTTYNIGVGLDMESIEVGMWSMTYIPYSVNLYKAVCTLDKTSGHITWSKSKNSLGENITIPVKSFSLSESELAEITAQSINLSEL